MKIEDFVGREVEVNPSTLRSGGNLRVKVLSVTPTDGFVVEVTGEVRTCNGGHKIGDILFLCDVTLRLVRA